MAKWILICPKCKTEFAHSQISDVGMARLLLPQKPLFEPTGNKMRAPQLWPQRNLPSHRLAIQGLSGVLYVQYWTDAIRVHC
jgi:hypothetical protein